MVRSSWCNLKCVHRICQHTKELQTWYKQTHEWKTILIQMYFRYIMPLHICFQQADQLVCLRVMQKCHRGPIPCLQLEDIAAVTVIGQIANFCASPVSPVVVILSGAHTVACRLQLICANDACEHPPFIFCCHSLPISCRRHRCHWCTLLNESRRSHFRSAGVLQFRSVMANHDSQMCAVVYTVRRPATVASTQCSLRRFGCGITACCMKHKPN